MSSPPSQPLWRRLGTKLGLSQSVLIAMLKNTIPSTAALWVIQSTTVGQQFDTVGFLPIIVTILMVPSQPRIPYLRLLSFTFLLNCIVLCIALLAGYCSTQARRHTTGPNGRLDAYNSSAAAVSGIWLLFTIWALQTFRTFKPHRAKSVVVCTIFTEASLITSATLPDMAAVIPFNIQLFEMFLLGYALSACTSLFVFPQSSRNVTLVDVKNMFDTLHKMSSCDQPFGNSDSSDSESSADSAAAAHAKALTRTFAKFEIDTQDAKKDINWSRFNSSDYNSIVHHFRLLIMPLRGIFAVESIRSHLYFGPKHSRFDQENALEEPVDVDSKERWDLIFDKLEAPMSSLRQLTEEAVNHCRVSLKLSGASKSSSNVTNQESIKEDPGSEKTVDELPGGGGFATDFERRLYQQQDLLKVVLTQLKDGDGPLASIEHVSSEDSSHKQHSPTASQGRLLFALYIEYLYTGILEALLELVAFCDSKQTAKRRLQVPGKKRFLKTMRRLVDHHHVEGDLEDIESEIPKLTPQRSRMPDAQPPKALGIISYQRLGEWLSMPSHIVGSQQSFFGFRVACAVFSIAIVGFLGQTQQWFFNQRGLWAAIFIPFSMAPSSGEAKAMLLFRIFGSALSLVISLVNWYIVDGIPAGVIVFFFLLVMVEQYFLVKFPQWGSFWRPCVITHSIIVGYSLQDKHSNIPQPPATTTQHYPIYLIGPYRWLCTLIGVSVAYFWTVFPRPTTANSVIQRRLGQALFTLAEYHSCMHWAISSWAGGEQGDMRDKGSIAHRLMKERHRLFVRETATLAVIRDQQRFANFDITLGKTFPRHQYTIIADEIDRIMTYMNVVIFVAARFQSHLHDASKRGVLGNGPWETGMKDLLTASKTTSRHVAALIHILASSVTNNQPLPQFLQPPKSFAVAKKLSKLRPDLMDIKHAGEEGYKAFAVIEVSVAMMTKSLDRILLVVRDMVGEVGVDPGNSKNK